MARTKTAPPVTVDDIKKLRRKGQPVKAPPPRVNANMAKRDQEIELTYRRRARVEGFYRLGRTVEFIRMELLKEAALYGGQVSRDDIRRDIAAIRSVHLQYISEQTFEQSLSDYVAQQEMVFQMAMTGAAETPNNVSAKANLLHVAIEASMNAARAKGIKVDEPISVFTGDIYHDNRSVTLNNYSDRETIQQRRDQLEQARLLLEGTKVG